MNLIINIMDNLHNNYFEFTFTNDKSVGLYNKAVDDVYHSVYGALEEALEKFIEPLDFVKNFANKKQIRVLDICFGIGYNTKALLKKILQIKYKGKVYIDILEYDKNLVTISPFVKDTLFKTYPEISYILSSSFLEQIYENRNNVNLIMSAKNNKKFFEPFYCSLMKKYYYLGYSYNPQAKNNSFLHNIYYHCISSRTKKPFNGLKIKNFIIKPYFWDARRTVKQLSGKYDIIFLDAFTPSKLPTLWTLEFFNELNRLASQNCILVTYSNSSAVRHAMSDAGFSVGKLFDKNKRHCGTIASVNDNMIKNKLNEYDIGLMHTKAGIYYRDNALISTADEIIAQYKKEKLDSSLQSSSQFIKKYKMENNL